jgi:hypothetical protein
MKIVLDILTEAIIEGNSSRVEDILDEESDDLIFDEKFINDIAESGQETCLKILFENEVFIEFLNQETQQQYYDKSTRCKYTYLETVFIILSRIGNVGLLKYIDDKFKNQIKEYCMNYALYAAAKNYRGNVVSYLILNKHIPLVDKRITIDGKIADLCLTTAAICGDHILIDYILGYEPNLKLDTTYCEAAKYGQLAVLKWFDNRKIIGASLEAQDNRKIIGASLEAQDNRKIIGAPSEARDNRKIIGAPLEAQDDRSNFQFELFVHTWALFSVIDSSNLTDKNLIEITKYLIQKIRSRHLSSNALISISIALLKAAERNNTIVMKLLIAAGADVRYENDKALVLSVKNANVEMVCLLLAKGCSVEKCEDSLVKAAIASGSTAILELVLKEGCTLGQIQSSTLVDIAKNGHTEMLKYLNANNLYEKYVAIDILIGATEFGHLNVVDYIFDVSPCDYFAEPIFDQALKLTIDNDNADLFKRLLKQSVLTDGDLYSLLYFSVEAEPSGQGAVTSYLKTIVTQNECSKAYKLAFEKNADPKVLKTLIRLGARP